MHSYKLQRDHNIASLVRHKESIARKLKKCSERISELNDDLLNSRNAMSIYPTWPGQMKFVHMGKVISLEVPEPQEFGKFVKIKKKTDMANAKSVSEDIVKEIYRSKRLCIDGELEDRPQIIDELTMTGSAEEMVKCKHEKMSYYIAELINLRKYLSEASPKISFNEMKIVAKKNLEALSFEIESEKRKEQEYFKTLEGKILRYCTYSEAITNFKGESRDYIDELEKRKDGLKKEIIGYSAKEVNSSMGSLRAMGWENWQFAEDLSDSKIINDENEDAIIRSYILQTDYGLSESASREIAKQVSNEDIKRVSVYLNSRLGRQKTKKFIESHPAVFMSTDRQLRKRFNGTSKSESTEEESQEEAINIKISKKAEDRTEKDGYVSEHKKIYERIVRKIARNNSSLQRVEIIGEFWVYPTGFSGRGGPRVAFGFDRKTKTITIYDFLYHKSNYEYVDSWNRRVTSGEITRKSYDSKGYSPIKTEI